MFLDVPLKFVEGAIFTKDVFDFENDQPLGNFDFCEMEFEAPVVSANTIGIKNWSFRNFREIFRIGRDYVFFSDLYKFPMNYTIFVTNEEFNFVNYPDK